MQSITETERYMFFKTAENGIMFDELFNFQMGKVSIKIAELFYCLSSFV